jgi:tight adherence protein B
VAKRRTAGNYPGEAEPQRAKPGITTGYSKRTGVRFASSFVLLVPLGMALVGMSVGNGRAAYATPWGQTMVVVGIASVVACWVWAGRLLRLPEEQRVFYE